MSLTFPDHTDTDRSMMFMAANPATARHIISVRAWIASSVSARCASNGWAAYPILSSARTISPASRAPSRQPTAGGKRRERHAGRVAHAHFNRGGRIAWGHPGIHLPMQLVLHLYRCVFARECEARLISTLGLDAAKGRDGGADHDGIDTGDD